MMIAGRLLREQPVVTEEIERALKSQYAQTQCRPFEDGPIWSGQDDYLESLTQAIEAHEAHEAQEKFRVVGHASPESGPINGRNLQKRIAASEKEYLSVMSQTAAPEPDQETLQEMRAARLAYWSDDWQS